MAIAAVNDAGIPGTGTSGVQGCNVAGDDCDIAGAVAVASKADTVVLMMGIDGSIEAEGRDRYTTTLPGSQPALVQAILKLRKKTVLVLVNGGAMSLGPLKDASSAIVSAIYGGEMASSALSEVLFGVYNPSGKLAATMYPPEYVNQIPLTQMSLTESPGRTHMYYTGEPEFVFGHGLSYTSWSLDWADAEPLLWRLDSLETVSKSVSVRAAVANTGDRAGKQTALLFWRPIGHHTVLRQALVGYRGLHLEPNQTGELAFTFSPKDMAIASTEGHMELHPGDYELVIRDGSNQVTRQVSLVGEAPLMVLPMPA